MLEYIYFIVGLLILPGIIYGLIAQSNVSTTFNRYSKYDNRKGLTAKEVAEKVLLGAGITDVTVQRTSGYLTDHYDPRNKTLNLSDATYDSKSVSAIGVAAHEAGHAIQHHEKYRPLMVRNKIVPIVNFASRMFWVVFSLYTIIFMIINFFTIFINFL